MDEADPKKKILINVLHMCNPVEDNLFKWTVFNTTTKKLLKLSQPIIRSKA